MRKKKAQEKKRAASSASRVSSSCQSSLSSNNHVVDSHASKEAGEESFYDTGGHDHDDMMGLIGLGVGEDQVGEKGYTMDDIWNDIVESEENIYNLQPVYDGHSEEGCNFSCPPPMPSPSWDEYNSHPLWVMDEEESNKMLFPDQYFPCYDQGNAYF